MTPCCPELARRTVTLAAADFGSAAPTPFDLFGGENEPTLAVSLWRPAKGLTWWVTSAVATAGTGNETAYAAFVSEEPAPGLWFSGWIPSLGVATAPLVPVPRSGRIWVQNNHYADQNAIILELTLFDDRVRSPAGVGAGGRCR